MPLIYPSSAASAAAPLITFCPRVSRGQFSLNFPRSGRTVRFVSHLVPPATSPSRMRANYRLPGVNEHRPRSKVPIHTQTQLLSVEHQLLHELRLSRAKPPFSCITVCAAHPNERAQKPLSREQPDSIADSHDPRGSASSITFMHCTVRHCHFRGAGGNPVCDRNSFR